jgi:hypothetical protein
LWLQAVKNLPFVFCHRFLACAYFVVPQSMPALTDLSAASLPVLEQWSSGSAFGKDLVGLNIRSLSAWVPSQISPTGDVATTAAQSSSSGNQRPLLEPLTLSLSNMDSRDEFFREICMVRKLFQPESSKSNDAPSMEEMFSTQLLLESLDFTKFKILAPILYFERWLLASFEEKPVIAELLCDSVAPALRAVELALVQWPSLSRQFRRSVNNLNLAGAILLGKKFDDRAIAALRSELIASAPDESYVLPTSFYSLTTAILAADDRSFALDAVDSLCHALMEVERVHMPTRFEWRTMCAFIMARRRFFQGIHCFTPGQQVFFVDGRKLLLESVAQCNNLLSKTTITEQLRERVIQMQVAAWVVLREYNFEVTWSPSLSKSRTRDPHWDVMVDSFSAVDYYLDQNKTEASHIVSNLEQKYGVSLAWANAMVYYYRKRVSEEDVNAIKTCLQRALAQQQVLFMFYAYTLSSLEYHAVKFIRYCKYYNVELPSQFVSFAHKRTLFFEQKSESLPTTAVPMERLEQLLVDLDKSQAGFGTSYVKVAHRRHVSRLLDQVLHLQLKCLLDKPTTEMPYLPVSVVDDFRTICDSFRSNVRGSNQEELVSRLESMRISPVAEPKVVSRDELRNILQDATKSLHSSSGVVKSCTLKGGKHGSHVVILFIDPSCDANAFQSGEAFTRFHKDISERVPNVMIEVVPEPPRIITNDVGLEHQHSMLPACLHRGTLGIILHDRVGASFALLPHHVLFEMNDESKPTACCLHGNQRPNCVLDHSGLVWNGWKVSDKCDRMDAVLVKLLPGTHHNITHAFEDRDGGLDKFPTSISDTEFAFKLGAASFLTGGRYLREDISTFTHSIENLINLPFTESGDSGSLVVCLYETVDGEWTLLPLGMHIRKIREGDMYISECLDFRKLLLRIELETKQDYRLCWDSVCTQQYCTLNST